jgi:D-arabinose 1-dehydrogenase-like Zn-dependent alcohol dehydrogenase
MDGIDLTSKQISQSESLKSDVVKGFAVWPSEHKVVVVSTRDLTEKELKDLRTELIALPDEDTQAVKDALAQAEIDALVDQKKTELAVTALKAEGKLDVSGQIVKEK